MDTATHTPQQIADYVGTGMIANDPATRGLGIELREISPGRAVMAMTVRADMLNGFAICHGGFITTLADSTFAFACNSYNQLTVAAGFVVDFLAPAYVGEELVAEALEVARAGSTGVYDVTVRNLRGERVAVLRGRSHQMRGRNTVPVPVPGAP